MKVYSSIADIENCLIDEDIKALLLLLETLNSCGQKYYKLQDTIVITYLHKLNLFNFKKGFNLFLPVRIVGLPISIAISGIFGDYKLVPQILKEISGLSLILNSDNMFVDAGKTLSSFIFTNVFDDFDDYINSLRSSYRRRTKIALEKGKNLDIKRLENQNFNHNHYNLYKDVYDRSNNKLELLPIDFFKAFDSELFEFKNPDGDILAFIQILQRDKELLFLFCGFKEEDVKTYDIYYNILLLIIKEGIQRGVKTINYGQTSEETKSKIGCLESYKYLYIHHNNRFINAILKQLTPVFSYKGYPNKYRVYKVKS